jgi:hypothetical protein
MLANFHFVFHPFINFGSGILLGFSFDESIILAISAVLMDIDHVFYFIFSGNPISPRKFAEWSHREYLKHNPHFYALHTIEAVLMFLLIGYFTNRVVFLIGLGFLIHLAVDGLAYVSYYRSFSPWSKYFSAINYLIKKRI